MDTSSLIPTLALATLIIAVLAAVFGFMLFKRKPANRHPMEKSPHGAIVREDNTDPIEAANQSVDNSGRDIR